MSELAKALENLLRRAAAAHGVYEEAELNGVYDQDWAKWYADWLLEHGMNAHLNAAFKTEEFATVLSEINEILKQAQTGEAWAQYTARQLIERYR